MKGARDPGKGPTADDLQSNSSSRRIDVAIGDWKFSFAIDAQPTTGALRDFAGTVASITGVDRDSALAAVIAALATAASTRDFITENAA